MWKAGGKEKGKSKQQLPGVIPDWDPSTQPPPGSRETPGKGAQLCGLTLG